MTKHTTTQHIEALLVEDGREFAMVRKADLRALLDIAKADPHQGRYLDSLGEKNGRIRELESVCQEYFRDASKALKVEMKHGDERRRYMANNKALLARIDQQDFAFSGLRAHWEAQRSDIFRYIDQIIAGANREASLEAQLLRVGRFRRKYPSVAVLMDVTP